MFQATGDSSSTSLQSSTIERNIGTNAYQIMRITDGAVATVQRVTVRQNIPVEVRLRFSTFPSHQLSIHI